MCSLLNQCKKSKYSLKFILNWAAQRDRSKTIFVHLLGVGKSHNDAASVRTANPVPAACGLYYFEVKIISKGRDGYMGIGLTAQNFKANRLPGKEKFTSSLRQNFM